jgi:hypothetical protein
VICRVYVVIIMIGCVLSYYCRVRLLCAVVILLVVFLVAYCTVLYFLIALYCVVIAASIEILPGC